MIGSDHSGRQARILKGFATLASGTILSRVTGMLREMALAFYLGSGAIMDAYVVAFTLPNLFRRILGEKVLESAVLPTYKQLDRSGDRAAGNLMKTSLFLIVAIGSFITGLGMVFTPLLVTLFAPGFDPETHRIAVIMSRIMFPFLVMISVASMFGVILQTREKFGIYSIAPAVFNVAVIVLLWWGMSRHGPYIAAWGVLIGVLLETAVMVPMVRHIFHFRRSRIDLRDESVKTVNRLALPVLVETILDKSIVLVDRRLASIESAGSIAALGYSFRLLQLPYGILVLAVARTFYQHLVDAARDMLEFTRMIETALRFVLALMIPCTVALTVFSEMIVRIVYQRGAFDEEAVRLTTSAFTCYSIGMIGMTVLAILSRAFNAIKDTRTPVLVSVAMMGINIVLNYVLVATPLQHAGLALASSIAYCFAGVALLILIKRAIYRVTRAPVRFHLTRFSLKVMAASLAAGGIGWWIARWIGYGSSVISRFGCLVVGSGVFTVVYIGGLAALGISLKHLMNAEQD